MVEYFQGVLIWVMVQAMHIATVLRAGTLGVKHVSI